MTQSKRHLLGLALAETAGVGALAMLFYYLGVSGATGVRDVWAVDRVVVYVLLFLAPLLLFVPLNSALRLGPVWLLGTGSWALIGYLLIFTPAPGRAEAGVLTYAAFLTILFFALGSAFALPMGALSRRFLPPSRNEWLRALRQGSLLSLFVVTLLAMSPLGVLNWLNVFLVFTIVALTEFFFLARN
jgi:hypothetical protein